jgi:hypothetical protein
VWVRALQLSQHFVCSTVQPVYDLWHMCRTAAGDAVYELKKLTLTCLSACGSSAPQHVCCRCMYALQG